MADYYYHKGAPPQTLAAAGSGQSDGVALVLGTLNIITGADATKGATLPTGKAGDIVMVYSQAATNALPVYPASGGKINEASANAALSQAARKLVIYVNQDGTNWSACVGS